MSASHSTWRGVLSPQTPITQGFQAARCDFAVFSESAEARQIWNIYGRKYCLQTAPLSSAETCSGRIEIYTGRMAPQPDLSTWAFDAIEHGSCWTNGTELWLEVADSVLFINSLPTPLVQIWLGTSPYARTDTALDAVIAYALTALLRRCGYYSLHAAGLLEPESHRGALIVGDSGSGKSTLTVRLAQQRWQYLSDDQIVLEMSTNAVTAWGLRRIFSLTQETLNLCARMPKDDTPLHKKHFVEPHYFFAGQEVLSCQPTTLFFTKLHQTAASTVTPLAPSEAMLKLIRQSPWLCYDPVVAAGYTQTLVRLTQQCRAFQLSAGRDLLEDPHRAHELLTAHLY